MAVEHPRRLGEASLLAEGDPVLEIGERAGGSLERIAGEGEVVLQDCGVPPDALLEEKGERPLHLVEAVRIAEPDAGVTAVAERARRLRQTEYLGDGAARSAAAIASA